MEAAQRRWRTAFLLLSMAFLSSVFALQGALLGAMIEAFDLRSSRQGTAYAAACFGSIIALASAFFLHGRIRKFTLLKIALALCAAALAGLRLAPSYGLFSAAWFILGYGIGLMDALLSACMADLYAGRRATAMMCVLHTAYGLASMIAPVGFGALLSAGMEWRRVYLCVAAFGALLAAGGWLGGLRMSRASAADPETPPPLREIPRQIARSHLLAPAAAMFFHGIFLAGLNTWINRYAETLPGGGALPAMSYLFLGVMASRLLLPLLPLTASRYLRGAGFLSAAALALGLILPGGYALKLCVAASGVLFGAMIPCILSLGCDSMPGSALLVTTSLMLSYYLGQSVSSPLIGALEASFGLRAGIGMCAVCMAVSGALCLAWKRKE